MIHSRYLKNIWPSSGFSFPSNILHNTTRISRLWANSANKGTFSPQSPEGEEFQIFVIWCLSRSHQLFFTSQLCLSELLWHLDFLKIDTASTSQNRVVMGFVKKKEMWKEVWNEIIIRPGYKRLWGQACRAQEEDEVTGPCLPAAACSVPSRAPSHSSCLVCSLVFVFFTRPKIERPKKFPCTYFSSSAFFLRVWFPLAMILSPATWLLLCCSCLSCVL